MNAAVRRRRVRWALLAITALGVALRVAAWLFTWPTPLVNDEFAYYGQAMSFRFSGQLDPDRPPVTTLLNGTAMRMVGGTIPRVRAAGVVAGSLLIPVFFLVGRELGGRRTGLAAAAIAAVYPTLIGFSHYILSESYFLLSALLAAWLLLRQRLRLRWAEVAIAGALCGVAALTREVGLVLVVVAALALAWWYRGRAVRAFAAAVLVVAAAAAVIAPWSSYLYRTTGDYALVSRTTWLNLYLGNPPPGQTTSMAGYAQLGKRSHEREAAARRLALAAIRQRLPTWPLEKLSNVGRLFWPTSRTVRRLTARPGQNAMSVGEWAYRVTRPQLAPPAARRAAAIVTAVTYIAIAILGCAGLVLARERTAAAFLAAVAAGWVAPVVIAFAATRFRLPVEAILIAGSAPLLAEGPTLWREASGARKGAAVAAALAMAIVIASGAHTFLSPVHS
jgi:hypothetical protein